MLHILAQRLELGANVSGVAVGAAERGGEIVAAADDVTEVQQALAHDSVQRDDVVKTHSLAAQALAERRAQRQVEQTVVLQR